MASFFGCQSDRSVHEAGLFIDGKFAPCRELNQRRCASSPGDSRCLSAPHPKYRAQVSCFFVKGTRTFNCALHSARCPFWISTAASLHLADRRPKSCRCVIQRLRRTYLARSRTTFTRHVRAFQRCLFDNDHNSHGQGGPTMFARIGVMRR